MILNEYMEVFRSSAPYKQGILYLAGLEKGGNNRLAKAVISSPGFCIIPGFKVMAIRTDIFDQVSRFIGMAGKGQGQSYLCESLFKSVCIGMPSFTPSTISSIAFGWSPDGEYSLTSSKGFCNSFFAITGVFYHTQRMFRRVHV